MFSKTRQKIVLTTVLALVLLLAGTLGIIYVSNWISINRQNSEMLERYISVYSLDSLPGEGVPAPPPEGGAGGAPEGGTAGVPEGGTGGVTERPPAGDPSEEAGSAGAIYQLSSFYSVAFSPDGEVLAVDTGWNRIYTKEQIVQAIEEAGLRQQVRGEALGLEEFARLADCLASISDSQQMK